MSKNKNLKIDYFVNKIINRFEEADKELVKQWNYPVDTNTRHFILDNFLPKKEVEEIYSAFPTNGKGFFDRETFREKKRTSQNLSDFNPVLSYIAYAIQDPRVVGKISELCSMNYLEPDPTFYAGGLSMMFRGDYLNPHIDNSHDSKRKQYRRLNILYYVSPYWSLENGGNFELWDYKRTKPKTIVSKQNRLVVMETNKTSWHSVSKVLIDQPRCCISNYYFSKNSPNGNEYFHVTSFLGRPEQPIRRFISIIDNTLRNIISKTFKIGRGKNLKKKITSK